MQAYEGYFEDGRFHTAGRVMRIPERQRAIIILNDEVDDKIEAKTKSQQQEEAFERFIKANEDITDEPFDEEWDELIARGIGVGELNL